METLCGCIQRGVRSRKRNYDSFTTSWWNRLLQFFDNDIITIRYLGLWGLIGGFTEDFRPHQNEMYLLVIPSHTLWNIVDIRL